MLNVKQNLIGKTFGRLTVIKQVEDYVSPSGYKKAQWLCECSCENHNQIVVVGSDLKSGNTKSCGCLKAEMVQELGKNNQKQNRYEKNFIIDEHGEYGIGYCSNTGSQFYFDKEDFDKIKKYNWVETIVSDVYHRLLAFIPELDVHKTMAQIIVGNHYDHADRNPLNNRKYNLREATFIENAQNHTIRKDNTSKVIGVVWDKKYNKWVSRITVNKKRIYLGSFINKNDAIVARLNAEAKYFKKFAPQKDLFEKYGIRWREE